jgi:hypothetical protein
MRGVDTQFVEYLDEGHVLTAPANRRDAFNRAVMWIVRHIDGGVAAVSVTVWRPTRRIRGVRALSRYSGAEWHADAGERREVSAAAGASRVARGSPFVGSLRASGLTA